MMILVSITPMAFGAMRMKMLARRMPWRTSTLPVGVCGLSKDLLPTYDIMLRIYHKTIACKVGNFDEIHGFLVDLMAKTHLMKGQNVKLDVMNFL
jgi:hypothetical protein